MAFYDVTDIDRWFDDFAESVTLENYSTTGSGTGGDVEIDAIFDEAQEFVDINGDVVLADPSLYCKTSDVSSISQGSTITINSVLYYVRAIRDDGTGITRLTMSLT